jgi:alpha-L-fucosidase
MNAWMHMRGAIAASLMMLGTAGIARSQTAAPTTEMAPPTAGNPAYPAVIRNETPQQREARLKWFREARFGMFIHWGVYAVPAGVWKGQSIPRANGEWIMNYAKIPMAEYRPLAQQFTASKYDPNAWAKLAKDAGMKYVVITSKHHDGFALFDSKVSDWNAVKASAAKRDLIAPLEQAVRAQGLKFGLYYSQSQDWNNLGGGKGNTQPWDPEQEKGDFDTYLKTIALPQVREILDMFKPDILWWDTEYHMTPERARPFFDLVVTHSPNIIMNNRLGGGVLGDSMTPEQRIPTGTQDRAFEVCMTINGTWGYRSDDTNFKSYETLLHNLIDIASKGGNYLLNIGPMADGTIPQPEVERLEAIGKWLSVNGESIYGTNRTAFGDEFTGAAARGPQSGAGWLWRCTTRPGKLYIHLFTWPEGKFELSNVKGRVTKAYLLADPQRSPLTVAQDGAKVSVTLPAKAPDPVASVLCLEVSN